MVQAAKGVAQNVRDPNAAGKWRGNNNRVKILVTSELNASPKENDKSCKEKTRMNCVVLPWVQMRSE